MKKVFIFFRRCHWCERIIFGWGYFYTDPTQRFYACKNCGDNI